MTRMRKLLGLLPFIPFVLYIFLVYHPFFLKGLLPIPSDTVVGLYHPWRDFFAKDYPNGIPFKNSLITDAVRQEYPWRKLAVEELLKGKLPLWNPYSFSGYPLAANLQSAPYYPLNILYLFNNFSLIWSVQIFLQTVLGGLFMVIFLRNLGLSKEGSVLGTIAWVGSGFFVSWLETNTVVQTAIWLPFSLYFMDKIFQQGKGRNFLGLAFGTLMVLLAGHLQIAFYVLSTAGIYFLYRFWESRNIKTILATGSAMVLAILFTVPFLWPAFQFIALSGRNYDQLTWQKPDWFLPWQNLAQFLAPDLFGNPATLNYFGVWNYGEFVGYIGLVALIFSITGILFGGRGKRIFLVLLSLGFIFALQNPIAEIPFRLGIPFLSTSQPSRIIVIICFSLAVLSAMGLDSFLKKPKRIRWGLLITAVGTGILWAIAWRLRLGVSVRNLYLPTAILGVSALGILAATFNKNWTKYIVYGLLLLASFDSVRFAAKFLPFTSGEWLFPRTEAIAFLQEKAKSDTFRIVSLDERIMSDNFPIAYKLQSVGGYDPLYLSRYAEFMAAIKRNEANINPPFNYNRIIEPGRIDSKLFPLLNAKYVLSLFPLFEPYLTKVFQEGQTIVYQDNRALPRAFFVNQTKLAIGKQRVMYELYDATYDPGKKAIIEDNMIGSGNWSGGQVTIQLYQPNEIVLQTQNSGEGYLVVTDIFYPSWRATIDERPTEIYLTDYTFRGLRVPSGKHTIRMYTKLFF